MCFFLRFGFHDFHAVSLLLCGCVSTPRGPFFFPEMNGHESI